MRGWQYDDVASRRLKYWILIGMEWDLIWTILAERIFFQAMEEA